MDSLTFYFDRCFGTALPEMLRLAKPPFTVQYHHDKRSRFRFAQNALDDHWLEVVGRENWIVFSHDRKFHSVPSEAYVVKQFNIGCFYLWGSQARTWHKLKSFIKGHEKIIAVALETKPPFIYDVMQNGRLKRVVLP